MIRASNLYHHVRGALALYASASRVAAAIESRHQPRRNDLVRLGIDPHAFTSMGHG